MRNRFLAVILTTVRSSTWLSRAGLKEMKDKDQLWMLPLAGAGIAALVGFMIYMLAQIYQNILKAGVMTGNPEVLFLYAVILTWLMLFFLGIAVVMSVLYFSSDLPALIPLPIPEREVIGAKFIMLLLYSYPLCALIFLPAMYIFQQEIGFSIYGIISCLINFILLPVVPTALAVLFVFLLNRIIRLSRYRTLLEVLGMMLLLSVLVVGQLMAPKLLLKGDPQAMAQTLLRPGGLFDFMGKLLPPAKWIAISIAGKSSTKFYLLVNLIFTGLVAATMIMVGQRIFYRGYVSQSETTTVRRVAPFEHELSGMLKTRSPICVLITRDWAILRSNSTFLFQAFGEVMVLPLLLIVYSLAGMRLSEFVPASLLHSDFWSLGCGAVAIVIYSLSSMYCSSISREGALFSLSLVLPLNGRTQAIAKLLFGFLFSLLTFLLNLILMISIFNMKVSSLFYVIPMGLTALVYFGSVGLLIDLHRPLLTWSHPQQAMKSNMNVLIALGINGLSVAGAIFLAIQFLKFGLKPYQSGFLIAAIFVLLDIFVLWYLFRLAEKKYSFQFEI